MLANRAGWSMGTNGVLHGVEAGMCGGAVSTLISPDPEAAALRTGRIVQGISIGAHDVNHTLGVNRVTESAEKPDSSLFAPPAVSGGSRIEGVISQENDEFRRVSPANRLVFARPPLDYAPPIPYAASPRTSFHASMTRRALLIKHSSSRDDRVARLLADRGLCIDWCCPYAGDSLPEDTGEHALLVVYGGAQSANDGDEGGCIRAELDWIARWVEQDRPYVGLCLGAQMLARALGAPVSAHPKGLHEVGYFPIEPTAAGRELFPTEMSVYHWHKEGFELPDGASLLATGERFSNQAFRYGERAFGFQFHPEVTGEMVSDWSNEPDYIRTDLGAHSRARQLADAKRFDDHVHAWCTSFIDGCVMPLLDDYRTDTSELVAS